MSPFFVDFFGTIATILVSMLTLGLAVRSTDAFLNGDSRRGVVLASAAIVMCSGLVAWFGR